MTGLLATAEFATDRMAEAADDPTATATDLAELLVQSGTPFREAHAIVGELVRRSLEPDGPELAELVGVDDRFGPTATALFEPGAVVARRTTPGGGGPGPVAEQLERFRARLDADRNRIALTDER
jgi:argininosuccinate lyase